MEAEKAQTETPRRQRRNEEPLATLMTPMWWIFRIGVGVVAIYLIIHWVWRHS